MLMMAALRNTAMISDPPIKFWTEILKQFVSLASQLSSKWLKGFLRV